MGAEQFVIRRRPGWGASLTVTIECDPLSPAFVKLGLAVRAAFNSRANLSGADLTGAYLTGADLSGAYLTGAYLTGADLSGAVLSGAVLSGADLSGADLSGADLSGAAIEVDKIKRLIASLQRLDGYMFHAFELEAGGVKIKAGCRWFTPAEYREHIAWAYPNTDKAAETLAIIAYVEAAAERLGVTAKPARRRKAAKAEPVAA